MTTQIDTAQGLIEQVLDGSLAAAVVHAASGRPNIVAALLFEEKLVSVRTIPTNVQLSPEDKVEIDWGENFAASYKAVFRDRRTQPY
nr:hypothetical protein [Novosphingobium sp. G106]